MKRNVALLFILTLGGCDSDTTPSGDAGDDSPDAGADTSLDSGTDSDAECNDPVCSLVAPQCGCPSGQSCQFSGIDRVCGATGTVAVGQPCAAEANCTAGSGCLSTNYTHPLCRTYCNTDADCGGQPAICVIGNGIEGVLLCSDACDPVSLTGCATSTGCRLSGWTQGSENRFAVVCSDPDGETQDASCTDAWGCAPGYGCFGDAEGGVCFKLCDPGNATTCPEGLTCYRSAPALMLGSRELGSCDT